MFWIFGTTGPGHPMPSRAARMSAGRCQLSNGLRQPPNPSHLHGTGGESFCRHNPSLRPHTHGKRSREATGGHDGEPTHVKRSCCRQQGHTTCNNASAEEQQWPAAQVVNANRGQDNETCLHQANERSGREQCFFTGCHVHTLEDDRRESQDDICTADLLCRSDANTHKQQPHSSGAQPTRALSAPLSISFRIPAMTLPTSWDKP